MVIFIPAWISYVADITGILSFVLSLILLWRSEELRKTIIFQKQNYNRTHNSTKSKLMAHRDGLRDGDPLTPKTISDLRQLLHDCRISFGYILSVKDRHIIDRTLKELNKNKQKINRNTIIQNLDYLIPRFGKKEDS